MSELIKVAATSPTTAVAGAIAGVVRGSGGAIVQAIGASAVHQAVKSVAIARIYLQEDGIAIVCVPSFVDVDVGGSERTAVRLEVVVLSDEESPDEHPDDEHDDGQEYDDE